ncbi:Cyclopropane-fatty-acyl-phospholipid synthase [Hartmannibacter diazotrophicus]|uniref:Cyclopropane-fatty-acyl-phospholipid synthase n=1 Tax=Hartmannibacter diazotrophicus TaxID=1482074 RepID=A0A2C9D5L9_9HYPH|nr:cyclopropane-fatty-acyl-phospholipid synthase family protein [Hartmannibacter diazotrophicus]SON55632.1 Cyclopropane-fatty-acyl-phospholipid synthase [Hartmannibacter diazotrophicus]
MTLQDQTTFRMPKSGARRRGLSAMVLRFLGSRLIRGRLHVVMPDGERIDIRAKHPGTEATLEIHRWRALRRLAIGGDLGLAEAYIDGDWSSPDVCALLTLGGENIAALDGLYSGLSISRFADRLRHLVNRNSRTGSRRNISFHYDLGNDFYRLWLDDSMTYSSALFASPDMALEAAQEAKIAEIARRLDLKGGEHVLEIGSGWGALAIHIARLGAHVTTITLSAEQYAHVRDLVARENLKGSVDVRLQDYRDLDGQFDRVVSIEMLEAVGEAYWRTYFDKLRHCLKPNGKAVLQVITIHENRYEGYRRGADFIQRYVFPGGMLPTVPIIRDKAGASGLELAAEFRFGESYALTLSEWKRRFTAQWPAIASQGFDQRFKRLWDYYLDYCEAGFRLGLIDVGLYELRNRLA